MRHAHRGYGEWWTPIALAIATALLVLFINTVLPRAEDGLTPPAYGSPEPTTQPWVQAQLAQEAAFDDMLNAVP